MVAKTENDGSGCGESEQDVHVQSRRQNQYQSRNQLAIHETRNKEYIGMGGGWILGKKSLWIKIL